MTRHLMNNTIEISFSQIFVNFNLIFIFIQFIREATLMAMIPKHENVVQLIGFSRLPLSLLCGIFYFVISIINLL